MPPDPSHAAPSPAAVTFARVGGAEPSRAAAAWVPRRLFAAGLRLKSWLFLYSLAVLLPLLVFLGWVVIDLERARQQEVLADLRFDAVAMARRFDERLSAARAALLSLSEDDAARRGDWSALREQAVRVVLREQLFRAVTVVDAQDRVVVHTGLPATQAGFAANQLDRVEAVRASHQANVSGPFLAPVTGRSVVALSVPLSTDRRRREVMRAIFLTDTFVDMLRAGLPEGWVASVIDREGNFVARTLSPEKYVGHRAPEVYLEGARTQPGVLRGSKTVEGVLITSLILPIHDGDWFLGVAVPDAILHAPMRAAVRHTVILGLLWLLLSALIAWVLARHLTVQAKRLVDAAADPGLSRDSWPSLSVCEFHELLRSVQAAQHREAHSLSCMRDAQSQRDETHDLYDHAPCGYHSLDAAGRVIRMNSTELGWLGRSFEEVQGRLMRDFMSPECVARFELNFPRLHQEGEVHDLEFELIRKDGSTFAAMVSATAVRGPDGRFLSSRTTVFDITERKRLEARLEALARVDPLTGLGNRRDFEDRCRQGLVRARELGETLALLVVDVDHFKRVNDGHGHAAGDAVLQAIARAAQTTVRELDHVSRFGGEEFIVLAPDCDLAGGVALGERLRQAVLLLAVPEAQGGSIRVTVSIGVAVARAGETADGVLVRADRALYQAKHAGRNRVIGLAA